MASLRRFWLFVSSELFESDCFDPADPKQPIADQGAHQQVAPPSGDVSGDSAPRASPFRASLTEVRLFYRIRLSWFNNCHHPSSSCCSELSDISCLPILPRLQHFSILTAQSIIFPIIVDSVYRSQYDKRNTSVYLTTY